MSAIIPIPRVPISIRPATLDDVPFMDRLQKLHRNEVGWMPTAQFEGKVRLGHVLVAEERHEGIEARRHEGEDSVPSCLRAFVPVGYAIGHDQYFKRDDLGVVYQVNVAPGRQRGLIGAALVKALFDRSAYGCRLFCCWCAQDIAANRFWESLGFVPLAFRAGSRTKGKGSGARVHIFWQKRIVEGDTSTPWWFPSQTSSGAIREDRIVLPIPPGTHWSDVKPVVLPGAAGDGDLSCAAAGEGPRRIAQRKPKVASVSKPAVPVRQIGIEVGGLRVGRANPLVAPAPAPAAALPAERPMREPRRKPKHDPRLVSAARELRDRWLEEVNAGRYLPGGEGKYDLVRALPGARHGGAGHGGARQGGATRMAIGESLPALALPLAA